MQKVAFLHFFAVYHYNTEKYMIFAVVLQHFCNSAANCINTYSKMPLDTLFLFSRESNPPPRHQTHVPYLRVQTKILNTDNKIIKKYNYDIKRNKKREKSFLFSLSTRGRDRTGTSVTSLVFETNASTNSATWASFLGCLLPHLRLQNYEHFLN